jgi:hypothetical protein
MRRKRSQTTGFVSRVAGGRTLSLIDDDLTELENLVDPSLKREPALMGRSWVC